MNEYAWLVDAIRRHQKALKNLEAAVDAAIAEMPDDFALKKFLLLNKAEVKGMFLTEYDQDKVLEQERRDSMKHGIERGIERGLEKASKRTAKKMLIRGEPLEKIAEYSSLAEEAIFRLARSLGVAVR